MTRADWLEVLDILYGLDTGKIDAMDALTLIKTIYEKRNFQTFKPVSAEPFASSCSE